MFHSSYGVALHGMEVNIINVEADVSDGLPIFSLVGLLGSEVKEAKDRVRISIRNSGYRLPTKRITINLSPADLRKEGTGFDLPIAISILNAYGYLKKTSLETILFIGELSLNGCVKPVTGVLPMVYEAQKQGFITCFVPMKNWKEASMVKEIQVIGVTSLMDTIEYLNQEKTFPKKYDFYTEKLTENGKNMLEVQNRIDAEPWVKKEDLDFSDVVGQESLKRGLEIAAGGMHNVLMIGPPGAGKTMIAQRISTILPDFTPEEALEISKIYSIAGLLKNQSIIEKRPFRSPHHTITPTALTGGGIVPKPGELSLSMGGVLFLDELPEFKRSSLEVLRQPLEEGSITISRVQGTYRYPADFMLVGAMNPCPCGYYPDRSRCHCSPYQIQQYMGKISQPLLDRIDITVEAVEVTYRELNEKGTAESSEEIKARIIKARKIQLERFEGEKIQYNSQLTPKLIKKYCMIGANEKKFLEQIFQKMQLSARAYHRILKVARTIADLKGEENIQKIHLGEAVSYRIWR